MDTRLEVDIFGFLDGHGIPYERCDHPPVYTCEEAERLVPPLPGSKVKNLLICDRRGRRHFLVVVGAEKRVDMKALCRLLGVSKIRFASPERLRRLLGVDPGAVTILGIVNDRDGVVEVVVDREIWESESLQCHPLVNTCTLVIGMEDVKRFLEVTGHESRVLHVPGEAGPADGGTGIQGRQRP